MKIEGLFVATLCLLISFKLSAQPNSERGATLTQIQKRGYVSCGVSQGLAGFSTVDDQGQWQGVDVDFCRAVAAATLGDARKVKFVPLSAKQRFTALQSGEIDLLSRNTTWTFLRDTLLGLSFSGKIDIKQASATAMHFLEMVKIPEQAHKYPSELSGGQQQRAAIARSLCMEPSMVLFDEPTSALDPEMIKEVLDVMTNLAEQGMTMLCVTHEMAFAQKIADRVVFMEAGEIIEISPPSEFFTHPKTERSKQFLSQILSHTT